MKKTIQRALMMVFLFNSMSLVAQESESKEIPQTEEYAILNLTFVNNRYYRTIYIGSEPVEHKTIPEKQKELLDEFQFPPITEEMARLNKRGFRLFSTNTSVFPIGDMSGGSLLYTFVFKRDVVPSLEELSK